MAGSSSQRRTVKSAGEKKTNTPLSLEGDKQVAIMMIIVIINKVLLFFQIDHTLHEFGHLLFFQTVHVLLISFPCITSFIFLILSRHVSCKHLRENMIFLCLILVHCFLQINHLTDSCFVSYCSSLVTKSWASFSGIC